MQPGEPRPEDGSDFEPPRDTGANGDTRRLSPDDDASQLAPDERAELDKLRAAEAGRTHRVAHTARWIAACVVLVVASLLAGVAVIASYVRNQVLDTETYVQTVTPLVQDPAVRDAVAHRLTNEIVSAANLQGLANSLADNLVSRGAPQRVDDLVDPLVSGITNLLYERISPLLATPQFEAIWENINRTAHQAVVTVLTGSQGQVIKTGTQSVSIDLGALLTAAKAQLVAQGFGFASKIPNVSIQYTLLQSDKLPKVRTYTKLLNAAGSWLPYVALVLIVAGILIAPNRRRGLVVGATMVAVIGLILLAAMALGRSYYRDHLPPTVSQQAAINAFDIVLRYLKDAMRTLVAIALVLVIVALLAGPSRFARWVRRMINIGLGYAAAGLAKLGTWSQPVGRALAPAMGYIKIGVAVVALVLYLTLVRPTVSSALWWTLGVLVFLAIIEIFARVPAVGPDGRTPAVAAA